MSRMSKLLVSLVVFLVSACASYDVKQVDVASIDQYASHSIESGVGIAAEIFDTAEKAKSAFDEEVTTKGYFPVNLILQNGSDERILVIKETIEIVFPNGKIYRPVRAAIMAQDFENNKMAYALLGFGILSYASAEDANQERASDWFDKEIPDNLIVNPGRLNSGFVYFRLPNGKKPGGSVLRLSIELMDSNQNQKFEIRL